MGEIVKESRDRSSVTRSSQWNPKCVKTVGIIIIMNVCIYDDNVSSDSAVLINTATASRDRGFCLYTV